MIKIKLFNTWLNPSWDLINKPLKNFQFKMQYLMFLLTVTSVFSCKDKETKIIKMDDVAVLNSDWKGEVIAQSTESYVGWDVEIGNADNDGNIEIVVATGKGDRTQKGTSYVLIIKKI